VQAELRTTELLTSRYISKRG